MRTLTMSPHFREYLTGFRKRKEKRRQRALQEQIEKLKEEKRRIKQKVRLFGSQS